MSFARRTQLFGVILLVSACATEGEGPTAPEGLSDASLPSEPLAADAEAPLVDDEGEGERAQDTDAPLDAELSPEVQGADDVEDEGPQVWDAASTEPEP